MKCALALAAVARDPALLYLESKSLRPDWIPIALCAGFALASSSMLFKRKQVSPRAWAWLFITGASMFADVPLQAAGYWPAADSWRMLGPFHLECLLVFPALAAVLRFSIWHRLKHASLKTWAVFWLAAVLLPWALWRSIPELNAIAYGMLVVLLISITIRSWSTT